MNDKFDNEIVKDYVETMNDFHMSMNELKEKLIDINCSIRSSSKPFSEIDNDISNSLNSIAKMSELMESLINQQSNEKMKVSLDCIRKIMEQNNGIICTRLIEPLDISRQYLTILEKNHEIERIGRGIYIDSNAMLDDFYSFQLKYKKAIFSHMNALYFHGYTEEIPYSLTVTVPNSYHTESMNETSNVFYVDSKIYELGVTKVKTLSGNYVRAYDLERCICDIVRSKSRMDFEQVKKTLRLYAKRKDKDMKKLSMYSKHMNISREVMEMVGMYNE